MSSWTNVTIILQAGAQKAFSIFSAPEIKSEGDKKWVME